MNNYFDTFNNTFFDQYNSNNFSDTLFGPYEGYLKGNMFKKLYEQYKNYKPMTLNFKNEREESLFNLNQVQFAMHDINLYLDVFPNDSQAINEYVKYERIYNQLLNDYQKKYGAINVNDVDNTVPFSWVSSSFPWEVE